MHQLFGRFLQTLRLSEAEAELLEKVRIAQAHRFTEIATEVGNHPHRTDLASKLITFPLTVEVWDGWGAPIPIAEGENVGRALYEIGRFDEARPWFERAVAIKEKGDTDGRVHHERLSSSLHKVGFCLSQMGNYTEAQKWYERAVAEAEKGDLHGRVDHASLGNSLHQVGVCLSQTVNYAEAQTWYERAVAEAEKGDLHGRVNMQAWE